MKNLSREEVTASTSMVSAKELYQFDLRDFATMENFKHF
jgi:hypothetical protein